MDTSIERTANVVVLTGGAQGIGRACLDALLQNGYKVFFGDVAAEKGAQVERELAAKYGTASVAFAKCDIRNQNDVTAMFEECIKKWGQPTLVICAAAVLDEDNWTNMVDINLNGTIRCCYEGMKHMSKETGNTGGTVIIVGSRAGYGVRPHMPVYAATKAGLIAFARNYADDVHFRHSGVRFTVVCPGVTDTPMGIDTPNEQYKVIRPDVFNAMKLQRTCIISPESVARAILHCATKADLNGHVVAVWNKDGEDTTELVELPTPIVSPLK